MNPLYPPLVLAQSDDGRSSESKVHPPRLTHAVHICPLPGCVCSNTVSASTRMTCSARSDWTIRRRDATIGSAPVKGTRNGRMSCPADEASPCGARSGPTHRVTGPARYSDFSIITKNGLRKIVMRPMFHVSLTQWQL